MVMVFHFGFDGTRAKERKDGTRQGTQAYVQTFAMPSCSRFQTSQVHPWQRMSVADEASKSLTFDYGALRATNSTLTCMEKRKTSIPNVSFGHGHLFDKRLVVIEHVKVVLMISSPMSNYERYTSISNIIDKTDSGYFRKVVSRR
eukprot:2523577-Amphidinium_carterae.1